MLSMSRNCIKGEYMNELEKINEAEYFYGRIVDCQENRNEFKYNLSAFLTSTRSVLQYIHERSKLNSALGNWYNKKVSGNRVLKFFKCKRNINIHVKPINPNARIDAGISVEIPVPQISLKIEYSNGNENIKEHQLTNPDPPLKKKSEPPKVSYEYKFSDWSGNEDVITLCKMYLDELKNIVMEGQSMRFLV